MPTGVAESHLLTDFPVWFGGGAGNDDGHRTPRQSGRLVGDDFTATAPLAPSDAEAVALVRAGHVATFERLFRDLHPPLARFAASYGISPDAADAMVVDLFAAIWSARDSWTPARSIAAYCFSAVRNRALNAVRDRRTEEQHLSRAAAELGSPLMAEPPVRPDDALESAERYAELWDAIATLPERSRVLLVLRWRDELSIAEIAAVLGLSQGATKTGLTRAAQSLRRILPADFR